MNFHPAVSGDMPVYIRSVLSKGGLWIAAARTLRQKVPSEIPEINFVLASHVLSTLSERVIFEI